jgi:hypothetical protein
VAIRKTAAKLRPTRNKDNIGRRRTADELQPRADEIGSAKSDQLNGEQTVARPCILSVALLIVSLMPALADDGCDKFGWSVARERSWFAATNKPAIAAGAALASIPKDAFVLQLQADTNVAFTMPPERKSKAEHWFGGMIRLPAVAKPRIYQVTLSDEAWIDIVQDGRYVRSIGSTGRSDCPRAAQQLSGVTSETIAVAVSRID